jgi:DNA polymerase III sliding clamp (beta) subunit (PCNA family)
MEFVIGTADLHRVVKLLGVTARANTVTPEGRILIQAQEDGVLFTSHNGSTGLACRCGEATVTEVGETSIVFSDVRAFVLSYYPWDGESGAQTFSFKTTADNKLFVTVDNVYENGKKSKGKLRLGMHDPYGIIGIPEFSEPTLILNSTILKTAFSKILYAVDKSHYLASLRNVVVKFDEDNVRFAAANGVVVSEYRIKNITSKKSGEILLGYEFIMDLRRILAEDEQMFFDIREDAILVKFGDAVLVGRAIIGHEFPDYEPPFSTFTNTLLVDKDIFMSNILPFVDLLNSEDDNRLSLTIKDGEMTLQNDVANVKFDTGVAFEGEFSIDLNGLLVKQTVEAIQDDKILLKFSDEGGYFICDSGNFEDQRALILPLEGRG